MLKFAQDCPSDGPAGRYKDVDCESWQRCDDWIQQTDER
jgi:hypothetical protein